MQFTSESVTEGVMERTFNLIVNDESVPGVIWASSGSSESHPVLLMGHGGSQHKKHAAIAHRAHRYVSEFGFVVVAIDAQGTVNGRHRNRQRNLLPC